MTDTLTASEALFGFMGWLTSRKESVTFSSSHNAAIAADLVAEFCKANNLEEPRNDWHLSLVHPPAADEVKGVCESCGENTQVQKHYYETVDREITVCDICWQGVQEHMKHDVDDLTHY